MKKIVSIAALICASLPVAQATVITAWTFENNAIAVNNGPAPSTGTGTASSLGMGTYATPSIGVTTDDVLQGAAGDTGVNGNTDLTNIWRIRAQAATGGGAANGWSSMAPIGTQGVMFAASTAGYSNIKVSFDWYATNQGEANLQLQYTTDGVTWKNAPLTLSGYDSGLAVMTNSTSANTVNGSYVSITGGAGQDWFTGLTATIADPAAANNPKFAVQIVNASTGADDISAVGGALNNTSGNWRFDNVTIEGTFTGFSAGNLVLSRTVYSGDATSVVLGQALPPICPASANTASPGACQIMATGNGAYPSTTGTNNVFSNNQVDGSFGITSPIFLDQITPSGTTVNTFEVPSSMIVTSFSSKSELALNLSTDGSVITFMGYVTAPNTVDVSNSNTPVVYDPTNPSGGSYFRAVAQVGANGAIQVTPTNAYSGNNGRAAILANGSYYMVGNSNNSDNKSTAANVVASTGVEIATPGQAATTTPTEVGNFSITQVTNPATGMPYTADKLGKDNNFRGLTIFNNTLCVTKGSGGNGIDTVYQVGNAGSLPTLANAATAPITILPGFPTGLATNAGPTSDYPFGIWFANATTLYVADEGDGIPADAAGSKTAGLQKWILSNGTWTMAYVLQNGLNLGVPYTIANYPTALNPSTDGLRNITGMVNSNGTVTIYGLTSTVSSQYTTGDQGADPNKLVSITDTLANTTAAGAASETFTTLRTANAGEVLRGISLVPSSTTMPDVPLILSAASPSVTSIAQGGLAFALGQNLGPDAGIPGGTTLPTTFSGTSVSIKDAAGATSSAPLIYVSSGKVTFQVPSSVAKGMAQVTVTAPGSTNHTASNVVVAPVAPAVFTANGNALLVGWAISVSSSGTATVVPALVANADGSYTAAPINVGSANKVYLAFYATGVQAAGLGNVTVTVNGVNVPVLYAGSGGYPGIDQINVMLPASLGGSGTVTLQLTAAGIAANAVQVAIQ